MDPPLKLGIAGLGRAFMVMLPTFAAHPRVRLIAAADPREDARRRFQSDFGGRSYPTMEALCADPDVEAVYIATPHQCHAEHVVLAARYGKHALVEKPMALTLEECESMIDAARNAGVRLIVGHSHSFDAPFLRARELVAGGTFGAVRMIHGTQLHRLSVSSAPPGRARHGTGRRRRVQPGRASDRLVRLLGGGMTRSVRAHTGSLGSGPPDRRGVFGAILTFEDGTFASVTYSGYAHFDSDELTGWIGELGHAEGPGEATAPLARRFPVAITRRKRPR